MSVYTKRMAVIKQVNGGFSSEGKIVSGIVRAEEGEATVSVSVSLMNAQPKERGGYYAVIKGALDKVAVFELGTYPMTFSGDETFCLNIKEGMACLIAYAENENVSAVAFGSSGTIGSGINDLKLKFVSDFLLPRLTPEIKYTDDLLADENYYAKKGASGANNGANGSSGYGAGGYGSSGYGANNGSSGYGTSGARKNENTANGEYKKIKTTASDYGLNNFSSGINAEGLDGEGEAAATVSENKTAFERLGLGNFYETVKSDVEGALQKYPPNRELNKTVPFSKWVKVPYGSDKYYTVGLIYEGGKPKYICYGVPGTYSRTPPKALEGYSSFLPLSLFDMKGDGYWMMYQNAKTGESVKIEIIE